MRLTQSLCVVSQDTAVKIVGVRACLAIRKDYIYAGLKER